MDNIRIRLKEGNKKGSELRKFVCQLEGEGGEDEVQIAAVLEIAGTEERRSELTVWAIVDLPVPASPFSQKTGD